MSKPIPPPARSRSSERGFTMAEVMIALIVFIVAVVGLVAMEARTLRFIALHPGCTHHDIVRESGRDKAQIARIVKVLLDRGEIRKTPIAGGKRQQLEVTPVGAKSHEKAEALRTVVAQSLVADLGAKERADLERMLKRMSQGSGSSSD